MDSSKLASLGLALGIVIVSVGAGCASNKPEYLPPPSSVRPSKDDRPAKPSEKAPRLPSKVSALVAHGADGKPVYVELRESTGDPLLDQRLVDAVLKTKSFPPGKADTVLIPVEVKSILRE